MITRRHVQPERRIDHKGTDILWINKMKYPGLVLDGDARRLRQQRKSCRSNFETIAEEEEQPQLRKKRTVYNTIVTSTIRYRVVARRKPSKRNSDRTEQEIEGDRQGFMVCAEFDAPRRPRH